MKRIVLFAVIAFVSTALYGQSIPNVNKVKEVLGEERYSQTLENNPGKIKFMSAFESSGYSVETLPLDKKIEAGTLSQIQLKCSKDKSKSETEAGSISVQEFLSRMESPDFNILNYQFHPHQNKVTIYKLAGTGKILIIQSVKRISDVANKIKL